MGVGMPRCKVQTRKGRAVRCPGPAPHRLAALWASIMESIV